MLEPFQQRTWSAPDRRAWGLSISLLLLIFGFALTAFLNGRGWTYRTALEYIPKEITLKAYDIDSDLVEFSLGLPAYPIGSYFTLNEVLPEAWIYPLVSLIFLLAISLVAAGVSYFKDSFLYGSLALFGVGVALFQVDTFAPFGAHSQWWTPAFLLLATGPIYIVSQWFESWNLARRWLVILIWYGLLGFAFLYSKGDSAEFSLLVASLWFPLILASIVFIVINSTDVLQGVLTLVTKEENSHQSWLHFSIFSLLYLSNYLLIYLKNTGELVLDIFYPNPFILQGLTILIGFWMLEKKSELSQEEDGRNFGLSSVYVALASLTILTIGLSFALANDLMIEVMEDAICLIHFCMGLGFFFYVAINYFQLMGLGLRVHLVMFRPRYMPIFAIPILGLGGAWVFLLNEGYFPYYQSLSAKNVLMADYSIHSGDYFLAENYLANAQTFESRNQRTQLSLANLNIRKGNVALAQEYARNSMEKVPCQEAVLAVSQIYRGKNLPLQELLELQDGLRKFPGNGPIENNLGMSFNETKVKDSAAFYLSKATESASTVEVAKSNLSFYYLVNRLESEGLPQKSPESESSGNWAQLNNSLVFANAAREKSPSVDYLIKNFEQIPSDIKPFLLYHMMLNKAITQDSSQFSSIVGLEDDSLKKYYSEPLAMAKAVWKYRTGNVLEGIDQLLLLEQKSGTNRMDLDLLLGQIYFEQGSYLMAANFFKQVGKMGLNKARYWYALSCLDAGKANESAEAFKESLPFLGPNDRIRTTVLMDGLKSGQFQNAAQRSDPEKSAYLKVNWTRLTDQQVKDLIYLVSDKEAQRLLWQYSFNRAYRESWQSRCKSLFQFGQQVYGKQTKWKRMLNNRHIQLFEITGDTKGLEGILKGQKTVTVDQFFYQARLLHLQGKMQEAGPWYEKAISINPLHTRQVGLAIGFLSNQPESRLFAYEKALQVSDLDPSNVEFLKLYAILAVKEGLTDFAYPMVPKIEVLTSKQEALAFKAKLDEMVKNKYQIQE